MIRSLGMMSSDAKRILVIGGGISGITAAVEAAEVGYEVILVEKEPCLGGRAIRMHQYFPKMCPPACGLEINLRRIRQNPRITVYTLAEVEHVSGSRGNFEVSIHQRPRYVTGNVPIPDTLVDSLESLRPDEFNYGMGKTKALYLPHEMAYPMIHVLDRRALSVHDKEHIQRTCPQGTIDLDMQSKSIQVNVGSMIVATGWQPYDAAKIAPLGFGRCTNVITNVMMERLAANNGPTGGTVLRPSDSIEPKTVAFVQCAGSRDENHLPYCSSVCCMGTLKQTRYIRERCPEAAISIFYIDIRTIGRHEKYYYDLLGDDHVRFVKGKVARVDEEPATRNLKVDVEDSMSGKKYQGCFDLVILATGIVPCAGIAKLPIPGLQYDGYGFLVNDEGERGIFAAGCARRPSDVSQSVKDGTAAALKAIQCL